MPIKKEEDIQDVGYTMVPWKDVAILFEYVLTLYQPFFDVSDLLVDSVKLLPLFLRLRDDKAEIVLCAFNEVLDPFLLSLYLFHTLNDVNYDLLRLA